MKRSWVAMREKVDTEGECRACGLTEGIQAAHIIPRTSVRPGPGEDARNCIPLCHHCHRLYDTRALDILPILRVEEQGYAVLMAGGVITMLRRVTGARWAPERRAI